MAKNKHQDEPTQAQEPTPEPAQEKTAEITIQGIAFTYTTPYRSGPYSLTEGEANQLNSVRGENLRNNFASSVKEIKEAAGKEGRAELTEEELTKLAAEFAKYDGEYVFAGKRVSRGPVDPVMARARKTARETIETALRAHNKKPSDLVEGKMDELITSYLEKNPHVVAEAREQVERVKQAANAALGGVDIDSLMAPAEEQKAA